MKSSLSLVIVVVVLSVIASGIDCKTPVCDGRNMEKISDCSTCCAIGGFNKFDHKKFLENKECKCFKDNAELEFNSNSKQKKTGQQQRPLVRP
jgi:hypothetical protein